MNKNRFQELVQNCGIRYQLSSEHYQNLSLKKVRMILLSILESEDSYEDFDPLSQKSENTISSYHLCLAYLILLIFVPFIHLS